MEKQTFATIAAPSARGDEPQITISTVALDRDRDEVQPEGGDFTAYLRNPVVLFGHDRSALPVGSTTTLVVLPGRGIRARWRWLEGDAFAARVKNAFEQGVLRAASIGFLPQASEPNASGGRRFLKWELLEWSLVPLPANADAVRALKALDLWTSDDVVLELAEDEPTYTLEQIASAYTAAMQEIRRTPADPPLDPAMRQQVRGLMQCVIRETLGGIARDAATAAMARLRGRVD
jgi:HK97 family phage prohead protease